MTLTAEQCQRIHMGQRLNVSAQLTDELHVYISQQILQSTSSQVVAAATAAHETTVSNTALASDAVDIRLLDEQGQFLGLGAVSLNGRLQPKKLIQR